MSRFEHAFLLAVGPLPLSVGQLRELHEQLLARMPEIAPQDPWRLGLIAAEREYLAGRLLALEYATDPTERIDMSIGWLLLAAHAPDGDPHFATLAACRLADRIEARFQGARPPGMCRNRMLQAVDEWRSWTGIGKAGCGLAA